MTKLFFISFLLVAIQVNAQSLKTLSLEEQLEDVIFIQSELKSLHPGKYTYQSEGEFEAAFASLQANLKPDQTSIQFYDALVPVINQIGCGHTTSKIPSKAKKHVQKHRTFLPLECKIIEGKVFISKVLGTYPALRPGLEIVSIDGLTASAYLQRNLNRYPSDGRILSRKYQSLGAHFSEDYSLFHYRSGEFKLALIDKGKKIPISLTGIDYDTFLSKTRLEKPKAMELTIDSLHATATIILRNSQSQKLFSDFLEKSFAQIAQAHIQHLIIDVRFDSFNRDSDGAELYSYLTDQPFSYYQKLETTPNYDVPKGMRWFAHYPISQDSTGKYYWQIHPQLEIQPPKEQPFTGEVFVLTDGFTFSATSEFSSIVKSHSRGLIVGHETGGSYYGNNSGGMLKRKLPNSGIIVYIPPLHYILAVKDRGDYSRGVLPDIAVSESAEDIILNRDAVMEAALNAIDQKRMELE